MMETEPSDSEQMSVHADDVALTEFDDDLPSILDVQLHRRNPVIVREEIQLYTDLIPETNLADVGLGEMPGLENPEQWKRIASRDGQPSLPESLKCYQSLNPAFRLSDEEISQAFGSTARSDESKIGKNTMVACCCRTTRRRILCTVTVTGAIMAITLAITLVAILIRQANPSNNYDRYTGFIIVGGRFTSSLATGSSTLFRSYEREFCTVISTTLADAQVQYAVDYAACSMNRFRNGTIVGDFTLSFVRGQDITRLNQFLNRTLTQKRLFGARILSIKFDRANNMTLNDTDDDGRLLRYFQEEEEKASRTIEAQSQTIHATIDQGLSLTITITHENPSSTQGKNYKFILIPIIEPSKSSAPSIQVQIQREEKMKERSIVSDVQSSSLENVSSLPSSRSQMSSLETLHEDSLTNAMQTPLKSTEETSATDQQVFNIRPRRTPIVMTMRRSARRATSVDQHLPVTNTKTHRSNSKKFLNLFKSLV